MRPGSKTYNWLSSVDQYRVLLQTLAHVCCPAACSAHQAIEFVGYAKPSPIQMASIPLGLKQLDVIGVAETGSGKTAAFVIPMLAYIMKQPPMTEANSADGPYAVVLAPTRELAQQIEEETLKLAKYTDFK